MLKVDFNQNFDSNNFFIRAKSTKSNQVELSQVKVKKESSLI